MTRRARTAMVATLLALAPGLVTGLRPSSTTETRTDVSAELRVNTAGYLGDEPKSAYLMASAELGPTTYRVVDQRNEVLLRGTVTSTPASRWSGAYPAVYRLDLSALTEIGRYRIRTSGGVRVVSPWFKVSKPGSLFRNVVAYGVDFDQAQRDGDDLVPMTRVPRMPAHLNDAQADVYAWPHMVRGEDLITDRDLTRIGGPVDVEGGWFDAGDYLKFTHSSAYNDVVLFTSARLLGSKAPSTLLDEARYGLTWLDKMDDEQTGTLHLQVGIGSGNKQGTFAGDHDLWRYPQADDRNTDPRDRYVAHRPVFDAAPAGQPISPNLAGRVSAAFALAAQADATTDPAQAAAELQQARALFARADTASPPRPLVTALPHAFYPESVWTDDMELGAAEIARATSALGGDATPYLRKAAHWAKRYIRAGSTDTLNLYDVGALAHASLASALDTIPHGALPITRARVVHDIGRQLREAEARAAAHAFGESIDVTEFDANSHTFGLVASAALFTGLTGSHRFDGFASTQRAWAFGANPWGVSAMVGIGWPQPRCMQHQIANLSGSLDFGAVVNGPNGADNFEGGLGGFQDGMRHCSRPEYRAFDGQGSRYVDDVRAWQTNEPALDMTAAAILAGAALWSLGADR